MRAKQASRRANLVIGARRELESIPLVRRFEGSRRIARPEVAKQTRNFKLAASGKLGFAPSSASFKPLQLEKMGSLQGPLGERGGQATHSPPTLPLSLRPHSRDINFGLGASRHQHFARMASSGIHSAGVAVLPFSGLEPSRNARAGTNSCLAYSVSRRFNGATGGNEFPRCRRDTSTQQREKHRRKARLCFCALTLGVQWLALTWR